MLPTTKYVRLHYLIQDRSVQNNNKNNLLIFWTLNSNSNFRGNFFFGKLEGCCFLTLLHNYYVLGDVLEKQKFFTIFFFVA